jgi:hypothetical protein
MRLEKPQSKSPNIRKDQKTTCRAANHSTYLIINLWRLASDSEQRVARLDISTRLAAPLLGDITHLQPTTFSQGSGEHERAAGGQGEDDGGELHFECRFGELIGERR